MKNERGDAVTCIKKLTAMLLVLLAAVLPLSMAAFAAEPDSTTASETKTTKTTTSTTTYVISTSPNESLGSVSFMTSNSTRIDVGKSTTLYITTKDMSGSSTTVFSCSNTAVASIEKVDNRSVKVYGLSDGEVVISATVGGKTARWSLAVGNAKATAGVVADVTTVHTYSGGEIDLTTNGSDQLSAMLSQKKQDDAATIILGIIGWAAIISAFGFVLSVIFRNRTPQMNMYPGTKARFNNSTAKQKKRLLPDQYYRSIRKY